METFNAVKILSSPNSTTYCAQSVLYLNSINSTTTLDDVVYVQSKDYAKIVGEKKVNQSTARKRMTIVKIQHGNKSIHRRLCSIPAKGFTVDNIAMTPNSLYQLAEVGENKEDIKQVSVGKGCLFLYYWNHPFHATRITFKFGIISIISLIISVVSMFVN